MFYNGDLRSGIAKAVQESKFVACFVTDDGEESKLWENTFLREASLKSSLSEQTVLLRLVAGSQEAAYLAAIFPLPKTPTLVIIQNGELKEYITSGVTKDEFSSRLEVIFNSRGPAPPAPSSSSSNAPAPVPSQQPVQPPQTSQLSEAASSAPAASTQSESRAVQDMLAERAVRLEVDKKEKEAAEKAKRVAEAKARKAAMEEEAPAGTQKSADMKYALMQKKRQQDARAERERILKRVEDDKAERKEKEAQRKAQAMAKENAATVVETAASTSMVPRSSSRSAQCALQIRLFDGSTMRSRFPSDGTLRANVRPWIDEQQAGDTPYTFKQVLTPLPNRNISISDEEQSLYSQGLTPSATLILVPVHDYTSAYEDGVSSGIISRVASGGYGLISSGVGLVTGVLGSFLVGNGRTQEGPVIPTPTHLSSTANVRTLRDHDRDGQQFYNGNALNFEPRKDDDDKKED